MDTTIKTPNKKINIDDSWNKVSNNLRIQIGDDLYNSWFARMEVHGFENGTLTLSLPTLFLKSWIKSRYSEKLTEIWKQEISEVNHIK